MNDTARCPLCAKPLEPAEPTVSVPDLLIEMHEACYRLHREGGRRPDAASSASR